MKRIPKDPEKFDAIDLFDAIGRKRGFRIDDKSSQKRFLDSISNSFARNRSNPIILHGRRVEGMFGYVAASLGRCKLIKREDSGDVFSHNTSVQQPDYRIVLDSSNELFVEVKNCHHEDPEFELSFREEYLKKLAEYCGIFGSPVKIAIYWSRWNMWALVDIERLAKNNGKRSTSMLEAAKINEMMILGDMMIGTLPPLKLRLIADVNKSRTVDSRGQVIFTIGNVELYSAETKIEDDKERNIAFYLLLYGRWQELESRANIEKNQLISVDFVLGPETTSGQRFEFVGQLSSMISSRYNQLTTSQAGIERLTPKAEPGSLGLLIKDDYEGKYLKLWRFAVKPNYES